MTANRTSLLNQFRRRFWQPPRAHGDIIEDRTVSFLELFYDLVYVVVISRAAHTLAEHLSWRGVGEFAVVFTMIWVAWLNGTLYYELHGREDGRTRVYVFMQMLLLALLAVFTAEAATESGGGFAIVYAAYMGVLGWLWFTVQRQDDPAMRPLTSRYIAGMVSAVVVIGGSAALDPDVRVLVWAGFMGIWLTATLALNRSFAGTDLGAMVPTESLAERFGLFIIIVLGEVVVGVVTGMSEASHDAITIATGLLGLVVGFGIWWMYFDSVSRRLPREDHWIFFWMLGHLPIAAGIAAAGAAVVGLVEHAGDARALEEAAWLLGGSVALALAFLIPVTAALQDSLRAPSVFRRLRWELALSVVIVLAIGALRPAAWLLLLSVALLLSLIWFMAVVRMTEVQR
jgi:low temperature requirement protein LtrA